MEFNDLSRKELQALAKKYGIKANQSNAVLADAIAKALAADFTSEIENDVVNDESNSDNNAVFVKNRDGAEEASAMVVSGPFSANNVKFEAVFKSEISSNNASFSAGDKVQVCIDDHWVAAVVKRVNKSSFRVLANDGHEVTLKPTEIRQIQMQKEPEIAPDLVVEEPVLESIPEVEIETYEPSPVKPDIIEEMELDMETDLTGVVDATYMDVEMDMSYVDQTFVEERQATVIAAAAQQVSRLSSTPNRRRSSANAAPQAWDSSIKPVFHIGSAGPQQKKATSPMQPKSANKSFAATTPTRKPSIQPKMNAAQRLRMEALQKKSQQAVTVVGAEEHPIKRLKSNPTPSSIKAADEELVIVSVPKKVPKRSSVTFKTKVHFDISTATMSTKKAVPPLAASSDPNSKADTDVSLLAKRKSTPNFERMHQKNFDRQKSITSCVNRDKKINVNMDKAFQKAQHDVIEVNNEQENTKPNVAKVTKTFVTKRNKLNVQSKESSESDHLGSLLVDEPPQKKAKVGTESSRRKTTAILEHAKKAVPSLTNNKSKSAVVVDVKMTNPFKNIIA